MAHLELCFLGTFQARLNGKSITGFEADKVRALLCYLAVEAEHPHRREQLAAMFWPGWPDVSARASLRNALSNLRKAISDETAEPPFLIANRETIQFNPESDFKLDTCELVNFANDDQASAGQLQSILDHYHGSFLEGFTLKDCPAFDDWSTILREQLQRQAELLLSRLAALYEKDGSYEKAIQCARKRIDLEPWHEDTHRQLMRMLAASGQRLAALAQFEALKHSLKAELGVEPSKETIQIYESIRDSQSAEAAQPKGQVKAQAHYLPVQLTSFVGREKEVAQVQEMLKTHRLVTLTGAGGSGKTRLALQVASVVAEQFPDGVWLVELASISDSDQVARVISRVFNLCEQTGVRALQLVQDFLESKHLLLLLDNCEHLIKACSSVADTLLHACPNLSILTSSREALGIEGEIPFLVPSLAFPTSLDQTRPETITQYEAIRLFIDRAATVSSSFQITSENVLAILQICQQLDGIPLALELAAARARLLTVEEIARRLDDRFHLLTGGSRSAMPRSQTLRASMDWSYDLLSQAERSLLQRLAVFAGGWFLEAAEYVGSGEDIQTFEVLELLSQLVNKSLVTIVSETSFGMRYRLLETIRQYAQEKLEEAGRAKDVRERHLQYYVELAEKLEAEMRGVNQVAITDRLEADLDNLYLALNWSLEGKGKPGWSSEPGLRLASDLLWFWNSQSRFVVALDWLERLLDEESFQAPLLTPGIQIRAKALRVAGYLAWNAGENGKAARLAEASRVLYESLGEDGRQGLAYAIWNLGQIAFMTGDFTRSEKLVGESLVIFKDVRDRFGESECYNTLGLIALSQRRFEQTRGYYQMDFTLRKEIGDQDGTAYVLQALGNLSMAQHQFEDARRYFEESQEFASVIKNDYVLQWNSYNLGRLDWIQGEYESASRLISAFVSGSLKTGVLHTYVYGLFTLGMLRLTQGNLPRVKEIFEESLSFSRKNIKIEAVPFLPCGLGILAQIEGKLEEAADYFSKALEVKNGYIYLSHEALALNGLGKIAYQKGDFQSARKYYLNALGKYLGFDFFFANDEPALEGLSFLFLAEKQNEKAARLLSATEDWHLKFQMIRTPWERRERNEAIAALRQALGEAAFSAAWDDGKNMPLKQAVAYALESQA
jgi:predicted ATPase/DNA-binding SARP family transcriptional activator/Tfp pilus assembly protein PilF